MPTGNKRPLIAELIEDVRGSIAIIAAIALSVLMLAAGVAVDLGHAVTVRTKMQAAADSAALAAAATQLTIAERRQIAKDVFWQNIDKDRFTSLPQIDVLMNNEQAVTVNVTGNIATNFMRIAGKHDIQLGVTSAAAVNNVNVEIAMVLDVSGSMRASMGSKTRIEVLKSAAHDMVDTVSAGNSGSRPAKFAVVPFTVNVNIGTDQASYVTGNDHALFNGTSWAGCVFERPSPEHVSDNYNNSDAGSAGKWQAYVWPPMPNGDTSPYTSSQCLNPSDGTNSGYESIEENAAGVYKPQTPGPNFNCVRHPIMPLTTNVSSVHDKIDELTSESNQGTIIAPGISWGMRVLTPGQPFSEGENYANNLRKIIVVLTDGEQTTEAEYHSDSCHTTSNTSESFSWNPADFKLDGSALSSTGPDDLLTPYGFIKDSDPFGTSPSSWSDVRSDLHSVSIDACDAAKAERASGNDIEIYSIAVSSSAGPGTDVYDLLRNCASSPEKFFYASNSTSLTEAFEKIAEDILSVRLTH